MHTEEEYIKQEQDELQITEEALVIILSTIATTRVELEKELRNFYQKYGKDGVVTYAEARKYVEGERKKRLAVLLLTISTVFATSLKNTTPKFERLILNIIMSEAEFFGIDLKDIDIDDLIYKTWGADDLNWLNRLTNDYVKWENQLVVDIKRSIIQRKSIDEVLDIIDKRFTSIDKVIKNLGITESTAATSIARQKIFQSFGVKKYQYFSKVDERRCATCGELHGKVFPIEAYEVGVTASPMHSFCRCWEVPITD